MTAPIDEARLRELAEALTFFGRYADETREATATRRNNNANDASKAILTLLDALSAERERAAWKDIDTAPKDGTSVLLVDAEDHLPLFSIGFWNGRDGWDYGDFHDHMTGFTHWKPLTFEDASHG